MTSLKERVLKDKTREECDEQIKGIYQDAEDYERNEFLKVNQTFIHNPSTVEVLKIFRKRFFYGKPFTEEHKKFVEEALEREFKNSKRSNPAQEIIGALWNFLGSCNQLEGTEFSEKRLMEVAETYKCEGSMRQIVEQLKANNFKWRKL